MPALPPASQSSHIYLQVRPDQMGLFRYLLEGYDNLGLFTMLNPGQGLLKLIFSPHQASEIRQALQEISALISLRQTCLASTFSQRDPGFLADIDFQAEPG